MSTVESMLKQALGKWESRDPNQLALQSKEKAKKNFSVIQERKSKAKHCRCGSQTSNLDQPIPHLSGTIEANTTIERGHLQDTISPKDLAIPKEENLLNSSAYTSGSHFEDAMGFFPTTSPPSSTDPYNQLLMGHEGTQTPLADDVQMISASFQDTSTSWIDQSVHTFDTFYDPSLRDLSSVSSMETAADDFLEFDGLKDFDLGNLDALFPNSNEMSLDDINFPLGLDGVEQKTPSTTAVTGDNKNKSLGKEADECEYVLGGIGGEVPLIQ